MKYGILYPLISVFLLLTSCSQNKEIKNNWEHNKVYKWNDYYRSYNIPFVQ